MTFDQRSAGAEDRRKREEKSTDGLAEMGPDKSRQNRCQAAKHEARTTKIDCRQANEQSNAECRQDKRDTKQDGRQEKRDIKH